MISSVIVILSVVFAVVFTVAWLVSPTTRRNIEQPKHDFQESVQEHDQRYNSGSRHAQHNAASKDGARHESR